MPISTWTDRSGTLASGAAQTAAAGAAPRSGFTIQNTGATDLWFNVGVIAVAASPSIKIVAGGMYETPSGASPQGFVSVIGTAAATYVMKEWKNI